MSFSLTSSDSIAGLIEQMQRGDSSRADLLLQRYMHRLVGLATSRLRGRPELVDYARDVALSSLKSVCRGIARGKFADLRDRNELWRLLALITVRKSISLVRSQRHASQAEECQLTDLFSREPNPAEAYMLQSHISELFEMLGDEQLRQVARLKIDGFGNWEIAQQLGCAERTIERKLHRIRSIWQSELS